MRRLLCLCAFLMMAGAVLADDRFIDLSDPERLIEAPGRFDTSATARPVDNPQINFGFDEATGTVKHSHRCEGCQMNQEEWHFHHCADKRCKVKIPKNPEFCSKCGWTTCQCPFEGKPAIAGGDAERLRLTQARESRVRQTQPQAVKQTQFQARGQAPLDPIPETQFNGLPPQSFQSFPSPSQGVPYYGQPGYCDNSYSQPRRNTFMSGGVNALGVGVGAGVTYPRGGWWNGCGPRTLIGGNIRFMHLRLGAGADWVQ